MNALSFHHSNETVAVTHAGATRTFTVERLREIASTLLAYYREGETDLALSLPYSLDASIYGSDCPEQFDEDCQEYWSHREELYAYIAEQNLFPITLAKHTAGDVNLETVTTEWRKSIGNTVISATFELWKSGDALLQNADLANQDDRTAIVQAYGNACRQTPLCTEIRRIALEQYGIAEVSEQHKLCVFHPICHESDGAVFLANQLIRKIFEGGFTLEELDSLRTKILAAVPARNAVLASLLENSY